MRNHHAGIVLATCLTAAGAAAQAPGTPIAFTPRTHTSPWLNGSAPAAERGLGSDAAREFEFEPLVPQDQREDYSPPAQFMKYHRDFLMRRERFNPLVELRARFLPNQRVNDEAGSFDLFAYEADVDVPLVLWTDGYLKVGVYHQTRDYQFDDDFVIADAAAPQPQLDDEMLHASGVKLGFGAFVDENIFLEVETRPGIWSDMDAGLHGKDFDFPSHALVTFRPVEDFFVKVGARYNKVFEDAPWLPYLGFSWRMGDVARIDVLAPEYAEFSLWMTPSTGLLFGAEIQGGEYHVRTSLAQRELNAANPSSQRADVQVQEVLIYGGLMHRFNDYFSLYARGGLVAAGDYNLTSGDVTPGGVGSNGGRTEGALDQGAFAEITIGLDW